MKQRTALIISAGATAFLMAMAAATAAGITVLEDALAARQSAPAAATGRGEIRQVQPRRAEEQRAAPQAGSSAPGAATQDMITADQAATIALRLARGAALVRRPELVDFRGSAAYQVTLDAGTLYLDARTGRVLGVGMPENAPNSRSRSGGDGFNGRSD